ncbi:DNA-binding domain of Mlu1-box binding protein MBP1 [Lizonia empirigonia]|nr:DNA-binding domain of Mlu1-box binding protein MBP1 [Lizonia empirigonia]
MDIKSLLNSPSSDSRTYPRSASLCSASTQHCLPPVGIAKRQKIPKDAPIFSEGNKTVGKINYPPHETGDDRVLEALHREFHVFPLGQIQKKGVRHIPYNSDKKDFLDKTGRDAFEVFQYTYKRPGEDKEYVVVWDYNVGLVRMTPFFKSCKYSKTIPAKALRENPGMKDISYSITGGALVCQGYWMPYQAAREIAATFCWDIRWALTPVFGNDFPQICKPPSHPCFAKFGIDPQIVRFCALETDRFRKEGASYQLLLPKTPSPVMASLRPVLSSPEWTQSGGSGDLESGYGSDERADEGVFSNQASPKCQLTHLTPIKEIGSPTSPNTPIFSSPSSPAVKRAPLAQLLPAFSPEKQRNWSLCTKRTHSKFAYTEDGSGAKVDTPQMCLAQPTHDLRRSTPELDTHALEAAEVLMLLVGTCDAAALPSPKRARRGSRY